LLDSINPRRPKTGTATCRHMQFGSRENRHFVTVPTLISFILFFLCLGNNFHLAFCFSTPVPTKIPCHRQDSSNYLDILASDAPLLDVRAPAEYIKGSLPKAHNIPLLNDKHRALIGTCYKEQGQEAAISLGQDVIRGKYKDGLVQSWKDHIAQYPNGYLFCARGGLRSHIVQKWVQEATGVKYPLIIGGYKAMRSSLLLDLEISLKSLPIVLISGGTCSGKTLALKRMSRHVDLEGLANHRGSAFGAIAQDDQPAQQDFENSIMIELRKHRDSSSPVFMEDEGNMIGRRTLPVSMHALMNDFPLIILETPLQERIDICIQEYIQDPFQAFLGAGGQREYDANTNADDINSNEEAHARIRNKGLDAVGQINKKLQRKLGGTCNEGFDILGEIEKAFDLFKSTNASNVSGFRKPIQLLLKDYYDPMYDYQMSRKQKGEVLFCGSMEEIVKWAADYRVLS